MFFYYISLACKLHTYILCVIMIACATDNTVRFLVLQRAIINNCAASRSVRLKNNPNKWTVICIKLQLRIFVSQSHWQIALFGKVVGFKSMFYTTSRYVTYKSVPVTRFDLVTSGLTHISSSDQSY